MGRGVERDRRRADGEQTGLCRRRFVVRVATRGDDRLLIRGTANGLRMSYGPRRRSTCARDQDADYAGKARRVRGWLAKSDAVLRFRQINEALEQQDAVSPEALSLRVTGALLAELLGDPGAAKRLSRAITAKLAQRLRKAQSGGSGYTLSCWDTYARLVVAAANALESCYCQLCRLQPDAQASARSCGRCRWSRRGSSSSVARRSR